MVATPITAPITDPAKSEKKTPCHPKKAPIQARNFTSPNPIASRGRMTSVTEARMGIRSPSPFRGHSLFPCCKTEWLIERRPGPSNSPLISKEADSASIRSLSR